MKIRETKDIRVINRLTILNLINKEQKISRAEIANNTGLNKATVSTIVKELIELELIEETEIGDSNGGRRPIILMLKEDIGYIFSIDINITHIEFIISDIGNNIIQKKYLNIIDENFYNTYNYLCNFLDETIKKLPKKKYGIIGIGVSVRGVVDLNGIIRLIPKLGWRNINIKALLEEKYKIPVFVDNDGNFSAMAEYEYYKPLKDLIVINIDEVITSGIISNGQIIRGFLGFANAIGHHVINHDGEKCVCGKRGCLEMYCSNSAIIQKIRLKKDVKTISDFINLVKKQDKDSILILNDFLDNLSIGLTNLIYILNPELIVINSIIFEKLPELIPDLEKRIVLPITNFQDIAVSKVGEISSLKGALTYTKEQFYKTILNF
ncbi:ROK family protein [Oceanotoga teriensis]|uniref:ROK family protein n=1 Tax=Oceanotoga teriensis TaxID=515440 RepID=UPI002712C06F|nr:ROK family protein [Oceanotoga teriensis]MDO7977842.1 ROK family protein [Oceanotoga teriensis]